MSYADATKRTDATYFHGTVDIYTHDTVHYPTEDTYTHGTVLTYPSGTDRVTHLNGTDRI